MPDGYPIVGPQSGDQSGFLWILAGPLLLMLICFSLMLIVMLPISIFASAERIKRSEVLLDPFTTLCLFAITFAAWVLLIFFCDYFDLSLLAAVFATVVSLLPLIVIGAFVWAGLETLINLFRDFEVTFGLGIRKI